MKIGGQATVKVLGDGSVLAHTPAGTSVHYTPGHQDVQWTQGLARFVESRSYLARNRDGTVTVTLVVHPPAITNVGFYGP